MGSIYETRTVCGTQEFTLDYTKDNTYYLSSVAYGEWDTHEFNKEEELDKFLQEVWSFNNKQVEELKQCMYKYGE